MEYETGMVNVSNSGGALVYLSRAVPIVDRGSMILFELQKSLFSEGKKGMKIVHKDAGSNDLGKVIGTNFYTT